LYLSLNLVHLLVELVQLLPALLDLVVQLVDLFFVLLLQVMKLETRARSVDITARECSTARNLVAVERDAIEALVPRVLGRHFYIPADERFAEDVAHRDSVPIAETHLVDQWKSVLSVRWVVFSRSDEAIQRQEGHFAGQLHPVHFVEISGSDAGVSHDVVEQSTSSCHFYSGEERLKQFRLSHSSKKS